MSTGIGIGIASGVFQTRAGLASGGGGTLLLDLYGAGIEAAYSVRKLSSSYAGSSIRVRRSSDNSEQDIGFDANGDLDTSALTTFVGANDGYVVKWYDQSGSSNDGVQTNSSLQGHIVFNGTIKTQGGKPAVTQDADLGNPSNQFLAVSSINAVHNFIVFYQPAVGGAVHTMLIQQERH